MNSIVVNLMQVRERIELAALAAKREPEEIELLAVSKTFPASAVEEAMHAGQSAFGEKSRSLPNYALGWYGTSLGHYRATKPERLRSILIGFTVLIASKLQNVSPLKEVNSLI